MKPKSARLLVAGGGTGGHVSAGIAVIDAWRAKWGEDSVLFVGAKGGLEERMIPRAHIPLKVLKVGPLNRVSWVIRIRSLFQLFFAFFQSALILIRFRPSAVLGVGGFASGPIVALASVLTRARIAVLEQNSVMGMTNRILARRSNIIFSAFSTFSDQKFSSKVLVVGNPVRKDLKSLGASTLEPFSIFIFGGSRGAMGLNTAVLSALKLVPQTIRTHWHILHQTGELERERIQKLYEELGQEIKLVSFIDDMQQAYADASVVICRSGASSLAELARVGRVPILIPLPTAADQHQDRNAEIFEKAGAAWVFHQGDDSNILAQLLIDIANGASDIETREHKIRELDQLSPESTILSKLVDGD